MTRFSIKKFLPRTLYGRAAAILLLPMLTLQLAVTVIFIQRHFEDVTEQMTRTIVSEVSFILQELEEQSLSDVITDEAARLKLSIRQWDRIPSGNRRVWYDVSGITILRTLNDLLPAVRDVDLSNIRRVRLGIESANGPVEISFDRNRVSASNPHQLLVLMMFTGIFMTAVSFVFLRNQLRPIKQLADAANAFGRGQILPLRPRGAIEVRAASQSFLDMRDRIERQIEQRTMMLSGVSHDLRTPLTRMQLGLEMVDGAEDLGLKQDVADMTAMLDGYLAYAKDAASEDYEDINVLDRLQTICRRYPDRVQFNCVGTPRTIPLRPTLALRAIENLIGNGLRYGTNVDVQLSFGAKYLSISVEDDGPGIPENQREAAIRPFVRLAPGRNQNKSGVGLGLAITNDAVQTHGGTFTLGQSDDLGGLQAVIRLPYARKT